MRRKRIGERKHFYGLLACLIVLVLSGCSYVPIQGTTAPEDAATEDSAKEARFATQLQKASEFYGRGDFEAGMKVNQGILSHCGKKPPCDQALFNMGLIYASSNYLKRDYMRSMAMFQRVLREYPASPLAPQARTWVGVLAVIERSKEIDIEVERTKRKLTR